MATFIHCADLHLGCQPFGLPERFLDFYRAFDAIIDDAICEQADALLVAGDFFHHRQVNAQTLSHAVQRLQRLRAAGIPVYAIEGNHDRAYYVDAQSWMAFLNDQGLLHLLQPEYVDGEPVLAEYDGKRGCIAHVGGVRLVGLGYLGATTRQRIETCAAQFEEEETPTIVLLHAAPDRLLGQDLAGVSRAGFAPFAEKADYIALGHLHTRQEDGFLHMPGAPECVHLDEARGGEKGYYVLRMGKEGMQAEHRPSLRRPVVFQEIDLTRYETPEAAARAALVEASAPEGAVLQLRLIGHVSFAAHLLDVVALVEEVRRATGCLYVEVRNELNLATREGSGPLFDREAMEKQVIGDYIDAHRPDWRDQREALTELLLAMRDGGATRAWMDGALAVAALIPEEVDVNVD